MTKFMVKMINLSFSSCRTATTDSNTRKQNPQCVNTALQNINDSWKQLFYDINKSQGNYLKILYSFFCKDMYTLTKKLTDV